MIRFFCLSLTVALTAVSFNAVTEEDWGDGLSDQELGIQRWFSSITHAADRNAKPWQDWHYNGQEFSTTSLRYQLAFGGYGCAVMGAKTPAYRQVVQAQLHDICERMIDSDVWYYSTHYWDYGTDAPDPCLYENVMYTGHLTQLMGLYQLLTGDDRYATDGWDFVSQDGRKVHYTLKDAIERMHVQSVEHPSGGICCEPNLLFAVCNSHSANSFLLYDTLYGTDYASVNSKWFEYLARDFRNRQSQTLEYLYVLHVRTAKMFMPFADAGNDCWALGWGYPWVPETDFIQGGWEHLLGKELLWNTPRAGQRHIQANPLVKMAGDSNDDIATAFAPLVGVQVEGRNGKTVGEIFAWLDSKHGKWVDRDNDGQKECYFYDMGETHRIPATGNIAAALATDGDSLRKLFRTKRGAILDAPYLAKVDYPRVQVHAAEYKAPVLRFVISGVDARLDGETTVECAGFDGAVEVTRDREVWPVEQNGDTVLIHTTLDAKHVFEVRIADAEQDGGLGKPELGRDVHRAFYFCTRGQGRPDRTAQGAYFNRRSWRADYRGEYCRLRMGDRYGFNP